MAYIIDNKALRFLFSGGIAATVNLTTMYILTDLFSFWYVFSSAISFCLSLIVSFFMQKFITFNNGSMEGIKKQFTLYFLVAFINLLLNVMMIYSLVEFTGLYYLYSQILTSIIIAVESFFVYNLLIFKNKEMKIIGDKIK